MKVFKSQPNPQAGGLSIVCCPRLLIQYIRCYLSYIEASLLRPSEVLEESDIDLNFFRPILVWEIFELFIRHSCSFDPE